MYSLVQANESLPHFPLYKKIKIDFILCIKMRHNPCNCVAYLVLLFAYMNRLKHPPPSGSLKAPALFSKVTELQ